MTENVYFQISFIIVSYLWGSILFGVVVERLFFEGKRRLGVVDIPGSSGVYRQYGMRAAVPTVLLDGMKGAAVAITGKALNLPTAVIAMAGLAVIAGHAWPVWFRFRGGVGLSATFGVAAVLAPAALCAAAAAAVVACFLFVFLLIKYMKTKINIIFMSCASFFLPWFAWIFKYPPLIILLFSATFLIIMVKGLLAKAEFPAAD
jgi:acyl-phosphate glycerol 3-phosphate acyltransferase